MITRAATFAVEHQPAQVLLAVTTLARVGRVLEDVSAELGAVRVQRGHGLQVRTHTLTATSMVNQRNG